VTDELARLFVALELPEAARGALERWRGSELSDLPGLRLLASESLHLTLCFIGWRQVAQIDAIARACGVVKRVDAAELRLGRAAWLPSRRPRVLAVELEDVHGSLATVQSTLSRALEEGGWYEPERRPFLPHVTVARVSKYARPPRRPLPAPPSLALRGSCVTLYRSRLGRGGARYEAVEKISLN